MSKYPLPFEPTEILEQMLEKNRRGPDRMLHASSHMLGSVRHAQLEVAGAPQRQRDLMGEFPLWIGTALHEAFMNQAREDGVWAMQEVNVTPFMPRGWSGTADLVVYLPKEQKWKLMDIKTTKGDGIYFVKRDGAKLDHVYQASFYWHALRRSGLPMVPEIDVWYLPKDGGKNGKAEPVIVSFKPVKAEIIDKIAKERYKSVRDYLKTIPDNPERVEDFLSDALADPQARVQRIRWRDEVPELRLVPHWSTTYCPYDPPLCNCREQGETKIGHWTTDENGDIVKYMPRPGYEDLKPEVTP